MNISDMSMQIIRTCTSIIAFRTSIRLFSSMSKDMFLHIIFSFWNFWTDGTCIFLITNSNWIILQKNNKKDACLLLKFIVIIFVNISHMPIKIGILVTGEATFRTIKRFFARMSENVFSTVRSCFSSFCTHWKWTSKFLIAKPNWIILQNNKKTILVFFWFLEDIFSSCCSIICNMYKWYIIYGFKNHNSRGFYELFSCAYEDLNFVYKRSYILYKQKVFLQYE